MTKKGNKKIIFLFILVLFLGVAFLKMHGKKDAVIDIKEIQPTVGSIQKTISTTGTVEPQNRLEINPPIAGRVEEIEVQEGQTVKAGDILALMSSTERAALLDAARLKGHEELEYWQNVYKSTPLIAPIDGEVIVRSVEPGQTVTTSDAVLVLSDRLIVQADVDETDIGEIKTGQTAMIGLDAYPDIHVSAKVDHISYESELVNNVTIYGVDILPANIPEVFRSGMSANVEVVVQEKQNAVLLPIEAVNNRDGKTFVLSKHPFSGEIVPTPVTTGIQDDQNIEIISGISEADTVVIQNQTFILQKTSSGSNPFMPKPPQRKK